jgi:hypothetical protein
VKIVRKNIVDDSLYFYIFQDRLYWGRFQYLPFNPSMEIIFRTKPLIPKRWYYCRGYWFKAATPGGHWQVDIFGPDSISFPKSVIITKGPVYRYLERDLVRICDKHTKEWNQTERSFSRRLREFSGCYFMTFSTKRRQRCFL